MARLLPDFFFLVVDFGSRRPRTGTSNSRNAIANRRLRFVNATFVHATFVDATFVHSTFVVRLLFDARKPREAAARTRAVSS
jgi:hypothetical protein